MQGHIRMHRGSETISLLILSFVEVFLVCSAHLYRHTEKLQDDEVARQSRFAVIKGHGAFISPMFDAVF